MSRQDWGIIVGVVLLGLIIRFLFFTNVYVEQAVVNVDGRQVAVLNLNQSAFYEVQGVQGIVTLEIGVGKIKVATANCPDQTCVKTTWIKHSGQTIICIPNRLVVKLVGNNPLDAVVY